MSAAETMTPFGALHVSLDRDADIRWSDLALPGSGSDTAAIGCRAAAVRAAVRAGDQMTFCLELTGIAGLELKPAFASDLEAFAVSSSGFSGAFGTRDGLWIDRHPAIRLVAFLADNASVSYVLEATENIDNAMIAIPVAVAWTDNPLSPDDRTVPLAAIDRAMCIKEEENA